MRALQALMSRPWAMQPEYLAELLNLAERQAVDVEQGAGLFASEDRTPPLDIRDGVAVLNIEGPLSRRETFFSWLFGGSTYEGIAAELQSALTDSRVNAVALNIDSPGGDAFGNGELAARIHAARSVKPVTAYVSGAGCSAAYYLASAASEIVVSPSSMLGSIGTVMSARGKRDDGSFEFVSSQSPNKRPDPSKPEGKAEYQRIVDDLAAVFISDVAKYRGVSEDAVVNEFGQGGVKVGKSAVEAGMADRLGTFEDVLASLASRTIAPGSTVRIAASTEGESGKETQTMNWPKLFGVMSDEEKKEAAALLSVEDTSNSTATVTANLQPATLLPDPEKDALRAQVDGLTKQLQGMNAKLLQKDAEAFANKFGDRIVPAQRAAVVSEYLQAARDDEAMPLASAGEGAAPTRLAALESRYTSLPPHGLTEEVLTSKATDGLQVLVNKEDTPGMKGDDAPPSEERKRELLSKTPLGQEVLKSNGNGKGA